MRPRWRKVLHDLVNNFSRTVLVVISIAVGVFSIGVIVGAYVIISNDMSVSYAANNPMNIDLRTDPFDNSVVTAFQNMRGVKEVEGRRVFTARARVQGTDQWVTINVIAIENYSKMKINLLQTDSGTNAPKTKQVVLERKVLEGLQVSVGQMLEIELENGSIKTLPVVGLVQDPVQRPVISSQIHLPISPPIPLPTSVNPKTFNRLFVTLSENPMMLNIYGR